MACYRHPTGNRSHCSGVCLYMRAAILLLLALSSATYAAEAPRYLPSVWQRWEASDLVCTGDASAPVRTGITRTIDGSDRDQLSSKVKFETCFKGKPPVSSPVRVVGYSVTFPNDPDGARAKMKSWLKGNLMRVVYADAKWLRDVVSGNLERCKALGAKGGIFYPK
jgi:hypothetical protein